MFFFEGRGGEDVVGRVKDEVHREKKGKDCCIRGCEGYTTEFKTTESNRQFLQQEERRFGEAKSLIAKD